MYGADALVLGGDIAGKAIVPIQHLGGDRYQHVTSEGDRAQISGESLDEVKANIAFNGFYPYVCEAGEYTRLAEDEDYRRAVFVDLIVAQIRGWRELAAERLNSDTRCIITPGNDDPLEIDAVLAEPGRTECPEGRVVSLGPAALASLGYTNRTPWDTDRECDEGDLGQRIERILDHVNGTPVVLNFHCPPFGSGLDTVVKLDEDLRPVVVKGTPVEIPVGSTAVRDAILRYKPVVGLHGHIHECKAVARIGETVCINPGSVYGSGWLQGVFVDFDSTGQYVSHVLTSG